MGGSLIISRTRIKRRCRNHEEGKNYEEHEDLKDRKDDKDLKDRNDSGYPYLAIRSRAIWTIFFRHDLGIKTSAYSPNSSTRGRISSS